MVDSAGTSGTLTVGSLRCGKENYVRDLEPKDIVTNLLASNAEFIAQAKYERGPSDYFDLIAGYVNDTRKQLEFLKFMLEKEDKVNE